MEKKSFKITFDLKEGYSEKGKEHTLKFSEEVIRDWMISRLQQEYPIVSGLLQSGSLFYPSMSDDKKNEVTVSHSAVFSGELSSNEDMRRKSREVKNTLESLAITIKERLKQQSVFIIYRKDNWCI